jgi:hypothetical protein
MALHSIPNTPPARRESHRLPRGVHRTRVSEMRFVRARALLRAPGRSMERNGDARPPVTG